jgi:N-acetylmuramoyl-L-alanine amidase
VPDLKVKTAIAQVLLGTNMPSVLIELGFVSNEQEAIRLNTASYQDILARGICDGIANYCAKYA